MYENINLVAKITVAKEIFITHLSLVSNAVLKCLCYWNKLKSWFTNSWIQKLI